MKTIVLSCFDGLSGLQIALRKLGIKVDKYYASEVDESAMTITMKHFPNTIQLGDIRKITPKMIEKNPTLIAAGSPCQDFSLGGLRKGMVTKENVAVTSLDQYLKLKSEGFKFDEKSQSYLFWEFVRLVRQLKPKYFFLENVRMDHVWMHVISRELGVFPININSSLVSAQNRDRLYWTNIPGLSTPKDKGILLGNVIPGAVGGFGKRGRNIGEKKRDGSIKWTPYSTTRTDKKSNCIVTKKGNTTMVMMKNGTHRQLTVEEAEQLQTLPKNYTKVDGVSNVDRWHAIGNGWTIDVITHLLKGLKKDLVKRKK